MKIEVHGTGEEKIAEVLSDEILIRNAQDGLDLLGDLYYQDCGRIILYEKNISPEFFDLKNGIAGEILQKFANYRVRLALLGDFSKYPGQSIRDFILESNKGKQVNFVGTLDEALERLGK
jgi:hypothetical protein